jgi:hypothetical protein
MNKKKWRTLRNFVNFRSCILNEMKSGGHLNIFWKVEFRDLPSHASNYLWLSVYAKKLLSSFIQELHEFSSNLWIDFFRLCKTLALFQFIAWSTGYGAYQSCRGSPGLTNILNVLSYKKRTQDKIIIVSRYQLSIQRSTCRWCRKDLYYTPGEFKCINVLPDL